MAPPLRVFLDAGNAGLTARIAVGIARAGWEVTARADDADVVLRAVDDRAQPLERRPWLDDADDPDDDPLEALTPREHDVLTLLAEGTGNRAIADRLAISEHTVKFHLSAIFGKLGVTTRTAAVRRALRLGWIDT